MNLLAKYKVMVTTERERSQKRLIKGSTSNIRKTPPVGKVGKWLAPTPEEIVQHEPIVEAVWVNPHAKGTSDARRKSLMAVMEAIWTARYQGIINKVLTGQEKLSGFQAAVEAWARVCNEELKVLP